MGSHPYFYFTEYQSDVNSALQSLRQKEFKAGRYNPAMSSHNPEMWMFHFNFPPTVQSIAPGATHDSIEAALRDSQDVGTGSILDIQKISESPEFLSANALSEDEILALFGVYQPTRQMIEDIIAEEDLDHWEEAGYDVFDSFWETIDRGKSRYIIVYEHDHPSEIFFIGYSIG